jgi:hypothetical protein
MSAEDVRVRLLFVDDGAYHADVVTLPGSVLAGYERLIDCLREDPTVLGKLHVDVDRLCSAYVVGEDESEGDEG